MGVERAITQIDGEQFELALLIGDDILERGFVALLVRFASLSPR